MTAPQFRFNRTHVAYIHDVVMAGASFVLSFYLRLGEDTLVYASDMVVLGALTVALVGGVVFRWVGLYRGIWRYASLNDLIAIARGATLVMLIVLAVLFLGTRLETLPRSIVVINWFVMMALLGGPRFLYRIVKDRRVELAFDSSGRVPVLLAGAGDGAELFLRALARSGTASYRAVGIVAERADRVGQRIHGVEVLGTFDQLQAVATSLTGTDRPRRLVLTRDDLDGARMRALLDAADKAGLTLARLARVTELKSGLADSTELKPIDVADLLGRPQAPLDRDAMAQLIAGRSVLITGAGGSIGGELVRQIAALAPARIALLDNGEFNLYTIDGEIAAQHPEIPRESVLACVRDRKRMHRVMTAVRPDIVFHAAALKHVPLVEQNPLEGLCTNVLGTRNVADACQAADVKLMVLISTDKAVNPTSYMGASKRVAEMVCQACGMARGRAGGTRFVTVRFGNVLGSTGSVVPLFQKQLAAGGPLTVTDPRMTRYFMTVREAVELVLQASALGFESDADGRILVLDMGEPVRIVDLARQMIKLAGLRPGEDIEIVFTGVRPGEKLAEERFHGGEPLVETRMTGILLARPRAVDVAAVTLAIDRLERALDADSSESALAALQSLVPEFTPAGQPAEPCPQPA